MLLHQRNQGVEKITEEPTLRPQVRAIRRKAIDHDSFGMKGLHLLLDLMKVTIEVHFLRWLIPNVQYAPTDFRFEIKANAGCVTYYLRSRFIERKHQTAFVASDAFGHE